jgi:hypothetical protein
VDRGPAEVVRPGQIDLSGPDCRQGRRKIAARPSGRPLVHHEQRPAAGVGTGAQGVVLREVPGGPAFPGGPGNTDKDPRRFGALMDDLEARVFGELGDGTWVYPGHGNDTTLGAERPSIPEWRERGW